MPQLTNQPAVRELQPTYLGPVPGKVTDQLLAGRGIATSACRVVLKVDKDKFDEMDAVRKM